MEMHHRLPAIDRRQNGGKHSDSIPVPDVRYRGLQAVALRPHAFLLETANLDPGVAQRRIDGGNRADEQHLDAELGKPNCARYRGDRKSTRLNSSHYCASRMPSSA